jgi:phosphoribosylanthranilate isomerase
MPSGPGVISEDLIAEIAATVPPQIATFLLTSAQDAATIIAQQQRTGANTIQICDRVEQNVYRRLRKALPSVALVQVVHVTGVESVREAVTIGRWPDALLLDSGNPDLAVKELGGTGRKHDWGRSREIVCAVDVPVFLAGGLNAGNVKAAIEQVHPYGVDVCSGVRTNGRLDETKLRAFVAAVASTPNP